MSRPSRVKRNPFAVFSSKDGKLLERTRAGSEHAWLKLVRRYERDIYNYALRMTPNPDDAMARLDGNQRATIDLHLPNCESCSEELASIWSMQQAANDWQTVNVPNYPRRSLFGDAPAPWIWPSLSVAASLISVLVLAAVLTQLGVRQDGSGIVLSFGPAGGSQSATTAIDPAPASVGTVAKAEDTRQYLEQRIAQLADAQAASNHILIRTLIDTSREERRQDLRDLMLILDERSGTDRDRVRNQLTYLTRSQLQDEEQLRLLRQAILPSANPGAMDNTPQI
jgi:hypothetical protein